jgi:hypothetical protein
MVARTEISRSCRVAGGPCHDPRSAAQRKCAAVRPPRYLKSCDGPLARLARPRGPRLCLDPGSLSILDHDHDPNEPALRSWNECLDANVIHAVVVAPIEIPWLIHAVIRLRYVHGAACDRSLGRVTMPAALALRAAWGLVQQPSGGCASPAGGPDTPPSRPSCPARNGSLRHSRCRIRRHPGFLASARRTTIFIRPFVSPFRSRV